MFILGHLGFTAAGVRLADRRLDLRPALIMALLPDLIDKPLRALLPELVNRNTRGFGHSLLGAFVVLAALLVLRGRTGRPLLLWACFMGHFVLDRMWLHDGLAILLWPLLGRFPRPENEAAVMTGLWRYNLAGEAAGLVLLGYAFLLVRTRTRRLPSA